MNARRAAVAAAVAVTTLVTGTRGDDVLVPEDQVTIQAALDVARAGDTVRVAGGTYRESIAMKSGVAIIGAGSADTTIDGGGRGSVVLAENVDSSARLEGFTITGGSADRGGGMLNVGSSPVIVNCVFRLNTASSYGGGMFNQDSSPTITECVFIENSAVEAGAAGGGIYSVNDSAPTLTRCTFSGNTAREGFGGGMANAGRSRPRLTEVSFSANRATRGGGMRNESDSAASLTRVVFSANQAGSSGGAIENLNSSPTITGCTFSANLAARGGGIYNDASHPDVVDCTFSANLAGRSGVGGPVNALECGLWLTFGVLALIAVWSSPGRTRLPLAFLVPLVFLVGALSELWEAFGGAWWAPGWLLLTKAACGVALVLMFMWRRSAAHEPDSEGDHARVVTRP